MELIGIMPPYEVDHVSKKIHVIVQEVEGEEKTVVPISLIQTLFQDDDIVTIEKYRVYVPEFNFKDAWENIMGSNTPAEDEAVFDYDRRSSTVFLDKKTRKPLLYKFVIDKDKLYFDSKRVVASTR